MYAHTCIPSSSLSHMATVLLNRHAIGTAMIVPAVVKCSSSSEGSLLASLICLCGTVTFRLTYDCLAIAAVLYSVSGLEVRIWLIVVGSTS